MKQKRTILIVLVAVLGVVGAYYAFKTGQMDSGPKGNEELKR
jgi:uncharacterized membrane protein